MQNANHLGNFETSSKPPPSNTYFLRCLLSAIKDLSHAEGSRKWESAAMALAKLKYLKEGEFRSDVARKIFIGIGSDIDYLAPDKSREPPQNELSQYHESGLVKLARRRRTIRRDIFQLFALEFEAMLNG